MRRNVFGGLAALLLLAAIAAFVYGVASEGYLSRSDAAAEATQACKAHGGVAVGAQNQFFYTTADNGEWNATCADGLVVAGEN